MGGVKTKKIMVIGLFVLLGLVILLYRPSIKTYDIPTPEKGFFLGARTQEAFIFPFYEHPDAGLAPLKPFETLYSNSLTLYALAFGKGHEETLNIQMFYVEVLILENETRETKRDIQEFGFVLSLSQYKITENVLELPTHLREYTIELYSEDERQIFMFKHETHPLYLPARKYTLGNLFMDRLAYVVSALMITLVALGFSKVTVDKRKVVPRLGVGTGLWLMTMAFIVLYISAKVLIYKFGLLNIWWTYLPLIFSSYLFGFAILKPSAIILYFMKTIDSNVPTKEVDSISAVKRQNRFYNAKISWRAFLIGKEEQIDFQGEYYWYWHIKDSDDRIYIHKSISKDDLLKVELAGIHFKDVDEFLSELTTVTNISEQKETFRKELLELLAKFEVVVDRRALQFTKKYMELMLMEEEASTEKKSSEDEKNE